jgi:hypothetical protein
MRAILDILADPSASDYAEQLSERQQGMSSRRHTNIVASLPEA